MSIGKKIGGGFCLVILFTLILGLWAVYSMRQGAEVSGNIAEDRLPRFMNWSEMQNDLLEGAYYSAVYFNEGKEENIEKARNFLGQFGRGLEELKKINARIHYANTAAALVKGEKDLAAYSAQLERDEEIYRQSEKYVEQMTREAEAVLASFGTLIGTMGQTLEGFINSGNAQAARTYARNIATANAVYRQIGAVYQDLLIAERNNDIPKYEQIERRLPEIEKAAGEVDKNLLREECHVMFAKAMDSYRKFSTMANHVAKTLSEFIRSNQDRFRQFEEIYKDTVRMVQLTTDNTRKYTTAASTGLWASTRIVIFLLVAVVILGIIIAIIITRMITRPLAATQRFAQGVSAGDLERELDVRANDETGKLADALRSMVAALKTNINEAQEKSEEAEKATQKANAATARAEEAARRAENAKREGMLTAASQLESMAEIISSASTQLSAQIEQSDHSAAESAQRLQEAATAMNEMNATVQEVARNAGSASEASAETREKALAGQQVVHEVVGSMSEVHKTSLVLKDDMIQLNERAQDINRIMGVISDIADQTNLLALNAAIEAARAGEAGRGFAVVADEVRKLAEKTMTSTQDVSSAIHAIQESTGKSMRAVDEAVASIGKATEFANQSGGALEEIVATVEATTDQVQAIAAASEEQSAASEEINRSVTEVNEMSRVTAEAMREASVAVSDLANQTQKLSALISQMKQA